MKIIAKTTEKLDLVVYKTDFPVSFKWEKRSGVTKDYWFTLSGRLYIHSLAIPVTSIGYVDKKVTKALHRLMTKARVDILTDGVKLYSTRGNEIVLLHMEYIMHTAETEYRVKKRSELW